MFIGIRIAYEIGFYKFTDILANQLVQLCIYVLYL
jgi:hypothetical protein